jgi:serine protease Do
MKRHTSLERGLALAVVALVAWVGPLAAKEKKKDKEKAKAESGYIGVYMQELTDQVGEGLGIDVKKGVLVSGVADGSPAEKAGIEEGDVIVTFAGNGVASPEALRSAVREFEPGADVKLELVRDGKSRTITMTVGERPKGESFSFSSPGWDDGRIEHAFALIGGPRLGIQAHELENDALGSYFGAKAGEGVLVLDVEDESVAGKAGVQAGDVIKKIDSDEISSLRELREAVREFEEGDEFSITVLRHGKNQSLKATMDEPSGSWSWHGSAPEWREFRRHMRAPRAVVIPDQDDLREEIDDLREEIEELKERLDRKDG